jgi:hypothetical protein
VAGLVALPDPSPRGGGTLRQEGVVVSAVNERGRQG